VRVLHTSDWHVGRTARGRSRDDEHRAVLAEMAALVRDEGVDLVLVAGDIFDRKEPSASSEDIVYRALLDFTSAGAQVVLIAGNHDHPEKLEALRPLFRLANIHVGARAAPPDEGGVLEIAVKSGERARIAMLPWVQKSKLISVDALMNLQLADHQQDYQGVVRDALNALCSAFRPSTVNLLVAHLVMTGAVVGGGERTSEMNEDYWLPPPSLPSLAQYIALGHIHQTQKMRVQWPVWYCGSPLQLDFGEERADPALNKNHVLLFEAAPGNEPVTSVRQVDLRSGRRMRTVSGTLDGLREDAASAKYGDAFLRVNLHETPRAGLADEVRQILPNAIEVKVPPPEAAAGGGLSARSGLAPRDLLIAYLDTQNARDDGVVALFDELLEEEHAAAAS